MSFEQIDQQLVIQSNTLSQKILFPYIDPCKQDKRDLPLTALQHKLILFLVSLLDTDNSIDHPLQMPLVDLAHILCFPIEDGGRNRKFFISMINDMVGKRLYLYEKDTLTCLTWLNKAVYYQNGMVTLQLHDDLIPYLCDLRDEARTIFRYGYVKQLSKQHSCTLYCFFRSVMNMGGWYKTFAELLQMTGRPLDMPFSRFKDRVLDPCIQEINRYTDITVSYAPLKNGRKVDKVRFHVKRKPYSEEQAQKDLSLQAQRVCAKILPYDRIWSQAGTSSD